MRFTLKVASLRLHTFYPPPLLVLPHPFSGRRGWRLKAASRCLVGKSDAPVNTTTDDGLEIYGTKLLNFCMKDTVLLQCVDVQLSGFTPLPASEILFSCFSWSSLVAQLQTSRFTRGELGGKLFVSAWLIGSRPQEPWRAATTYIEADELLFMELQPTNWLVSVTKRNVIITFLFYSNQPKLTGNSCTKNCSRDELQSKILIIL